MASQKYTIDKVKKTITATITDLDEVEKEIVQMYINAGYILHKGKKNPWNKKSIIAWLEKNAPQELKDKFEDMCKDTSIGWVKARAWFFEEKKKIKMSKWLTKEGKTKELKKLEEMLGDGKTKFNDVCEWFDELKKKTKEEKKKSEETKEEVEE